MEREQPQRVQAYQTILSKYQLAFERFRDTPSIGTPGFWEIRRHELEQAVQVRALQIFGQIAGFSGVCTARKAEKAKAIESAPKNKAVGSSEKKKKSGMIDHV